ncbi:Ppx/GppA phosphatase family protein [Nibricoccus sp. IMCC34717]|uniref:Ppx/GppA phosphatase family protein n=1 Tax=Nibricoccus sp. IMCC34717 TaxID=3034021 RepID=UPI00384A7E1B
MKPATPSAAVVDIGSNTIKVLVVAQQEDGSLKPLHFQTLDARLGTGLGNSSGLSEEGIQRGVDAVAALLAGAAEHAPAQVQLVATSAVRDAANGGDFTRRVAERTGHAVRILSGDEEARLIGRGLCCDPALRGVDDFYVFDLGGGSLECLAFRNRQMEQATSLLLGCVRLTEHFVQDPLAPIPPEALEAVRRHTRETLAAIGFRFNLPPHAVAVGTGGTLTATRTVTGARVGTELGAVDTWIPLDQLRELQHTSARLAIDDRRRIPGMPVSRADVLPVALATLVALAEYGGLSGFRHSLYSLRWGVAAELLDARQHARA